MIKVSSLFFITVCIISSSIRHVKSSSSLYLPSATSIIRGGGHGSDVLHSKKKRRRRKSSVSSNVTIIASESHHESEPIINDQPQSNSNQTSTTRKRRRRRRNANPNADEICTDNLLLPLPDDEESNDNAEEESGDTLHPEIADPRSEEGVCKLAASTPILPQTTDPLPSKHLQRDKEEDIISNTIESEDSTHQTTTEVFDGSNPTITTAHKSSCESEKTDMTESNDGRTVTFTHQTRKRSIQITTKSRLVESTPKAKSAPNSLAKRPKPQTTGKGRECLRRIKREWKDAVKMGIAYDWTQMKTIEKKEGNKQNNYVRLGPFGKNLLRWHFSVMGPANSVYQGGVYHGRVLLPKDYPGSPPRVQMLTPSGRFVCGEDICLSASNYHPETWSPRWTVLSLVDALRLHMLTQANEIGGVTSSDEKRRSYAENSRSWFLPGVVDHRQMVTDGIFLLDENDVGTTETDLVEDSETINTLVDEEPNENVYTAKAAKSVEKTFSSSISPTNTIDKPKPKKSKSKKVSASTRSSRVSKEVLDLDANDVPSSINNCTAEKTLSKRLCIELLKLPLRMLSLVLMLLTSIEAKLRSILDDI